MSLTPHVVPFEEFVSVQEASAEAIIGTRKETALAADSTMVLYGAGGAGKTTLAIDGVAHWASGTDWLGLRVGRPLRVLLIENEGPRGKFREKLERKRDTWEGQPFADNVHVLEEPWGRLSFAEETHRVALALTIMELDIDIVVAGPVKRLGMKGGGTPDEVTAFAMLLVDLRARLERPVAFVLIHHENKAGDVSGAWEGEPDTLVHVQPQGHERTVVEWEKARWSSTLHGQKMTLRWLPESEGFELIDSETESAIKRAAEEADAAEWLAVYIVEHPGKPRSVVENAYKDAHRGRGRNLAKRVIAGELERIRTGEQHKVFATGFGPAANGVYLYPVSEASSPLAASLFGEHGEQAETLLQTPLKVSAIRSPFPYRGTAESGEQRAGSARAPRAPEVTT